MTMLLASSAAIRAAEQALFASGSCSSSELMDAVVRRLFSALKAHLGSGFHPQQVVVYAGRGNNAGDALGLAAYFDCPVLVRAAAPPSSFSADSQRQLANISRWRFADAPPEAAPGTLVLDGLLGSGAQGPLRPEVAALVAELNALRRACPHSVTLAVDVPTGLLAGPGNGPCVVADVSCPIGCVKPAMLEDAASDVVGQLLPIPLPEVSLEACSADVVVDAALLQQWLPPRAFSCFKNRAGRVAIIAGSRGMLGAARLCSQAAMAAGAGLVELYARPEFYELLACSTAPEVMVRRVQSYAEVDVSAAQALLIGPGLGQPSAGELAALRSLAEGFAGPVVLDADALNAAATHHWELAGHANWVLTPHPGEMRRLAPHLAALPRREQVAQFVAGFDGTLLLKGERSLIASRQQCFINGTGGPFMANGGQGDVLAGAVAALAAQGLTPLHAAAAGAHACGLAATRAWCKLGFSRAVSASQTISHLPYTLP